MQTIPGVVKLIDFDFDKSHLVLLEEWLDVREFVNTSEAEKIVTDILEVLVTMHNRNYRHNDIKPSNIGWSKEQQRWALLDFDSAEQAENGERYLDGVVGTYDYIAPEAAYECIRSTKSDIFSLGACVLDMCRDFHGHPTLDMLLNRMISIRPEKRPSAAEALDVLRLSCVKMKRSFDVDASPSKGKRIRKICNDSRKENQPLVRVY
jgi:serine/threonine protein kinase